MERGNLFRLKLVRPSDLRRLPAYIRNLGIWARLALAITTGFILFLTIFSLLSMRMIDDSTKRILSERQVLTQMAADETDALLARGFNELEKATTFARFDPQSVNLEEEYHMLAHAYGRIGTFSLGVYFYDAAGKILLAEPYDEVLIGADHSTRIHISQIIEFGERSVSAPFVDPVSGAPAVALTIPIRNEQGQLMAMLSGLVDLSSPTFRRPIEQALNLGHTGHAELIDSQGTVLVSTYPGVFLEPGEHVEFYRRMMAGRLAGTENVPYEHGGEASGVMHVMSFVPLLLADWGLSIGGDTKETFAPVTNLRNSIFLLGGFIVVVILAATLIGARRLVRPVKMLTRKAQEIAGGNLSSAIQLTEGGEIGVLGRSLEEMRLRLKESIDEIQEWNQKLEQRVAQRTSALEELSGQLRDRDKERGDLLGKIITAQEEERRRVARELHDDVGQTLAGLVVSLGSTESLLPTESVARQRLESFRGITSEAVEAVRRLIQDLRPSRLDDLGLTAAIDWYIENYLAPAGVKAELEATGFEQRLPPTVQITLFRVVQEAMVNIVKHARSQTARIRLRHTGSAIMGMVEDDGVGFSLDALRRERRIGRTVGLLGMEERINLLGGKLRIESQPGRGTSIHFEIPWQENSGKENTHPGS